MMDLRRQLRLYLVGTVIVWVGLLIATAVVLAGTPHFA
jgi:hypothetical protein